MNRRLARFINVILIAGCLLVAACGGASTPAPTNTPPSPTPPESTATQAPLPTPVPPTPTPSPEPPLSLYLDPSIPPALAQALTLPADVQRASEARQSALILEPVGAGGGQPGGIAVSTWVYAFVAPFPTVQDEVTAADIQAAWKGDTSTLLGDRPIMMEPSTAAAFTTLWGQPAAGSVQVFPAEQLLDAAWQKPYSWAIVPFDLLEPRWKVMRVDGLSPLDKRFDPQPYALTIHYQITGQAAALERLKAEAGQAFGPTTNRDPEKMTVLVMTGVTALVRATAWTMDNKGITYPARDIGDWLREADITHISNEVSFATNCPPPNPGTDSLRFCSNPDYIQLLEDVGTDIVELTGNHLNDWGEDNLLFSLDLYKQHNLKVYAGGANLAEARQATIIEDHGNKFAFIGCNPAGPESDWATETRPGAAPCDLDWEAGEIQRLRADGYLPIATFQYNEAYDFVPMPWQQRDFRQVSEAGAAIVDGSQAHYPQTFEFTSGGFIHYGLGNLFFDQMDPIINGIRIPGTKWEFVDRHVFYDGRHLSLELKTAMLEDYAKPRPMTLEERSTLLTAVFEASGW